MKVKTAYSQKTDVEAIVQELKQQIGTFNAKLVQFFATSKVDGEKLSEGINEAFNGVPSMGCTTSGEIISGQMLDNSVVLMAMGAEIIDDCQIEVLTNITDDDDKVSQAFNRFGNHFGKPMNDLNPNDYVGILLVDGLSVQEERINERIGDLTNVTFIGGSAGDDLEFVKTCVFANGKCYSNAAVLALIKSNTTFDVLKTQSFTSTKSKVVVTKADENKRIIYEFNGKPATKEYAALLGIDESRLADRFSKNPVGLVFENDYFVRSPQKVVGDSIVFYCSMKEGMELDVLESMDIVENTRVDLENKINSMGGNVSAIINFNCILRTLELKEKNQTQAYGQLFSDVPTIGFSTYGESYIGHINQTATILLFN